MDIKSMSLEDLKINFQDKLREGLTGEDIVEIAFKIKKSTKTIENYLGKNPNYTSSLDFITMRAIVEIGNQIIDNKHVCNVSNI